MPPRHIALWSLLIAGCFGTTALAYWSFSRTAPPAEPAAVPTGFHVSPEVVDFGTLIQGQTAAREVTISNGTAEGWIVDQIIPSCGCSAGAVSSPDLAVHSRVSLQVRFNSAGKFGEQKHTVRLILHSIEDPSRNEQILVTISVNVKTIIWADPEVVTFQGCALGGQYSARFTLRCAEGNAGTDAPRLIETPGADSQEFQLTPRGPLKPGANELELRFTPKLTSGLRGLSLQIDPGLSNHPPVAIRVDAAVPSQFRVEPAELRLGLLRPGEAKIVRVKIADGTSPFAVDHCPEFLKASLSGESGHQELTIQVLPERLKPLTVLEGTIRLKTGSLTEPILTVPVLGLVTKGETVRTDGASLAR